MIYNFLFESDLKTLSRLGYYVSGQSATYKQMNCNYLFI